MNEDIKKKDSNDEELKTLRWKKVDLKAQSTLRRKLWEMYTKRRKPERHSK